jgi:alpha,alpha-trehalase
VGVRLPGQETPSRDGWRRVDASIRASWDGLLVQATEHELRESANSGLLFLPFPYFAPFVEGARSMFAWDSYFVVRGLLAHERLDLARYHILNYLFLVERLGYMPNASAASLTTRSQTPVFPDVVWRWFAATGDEDVLMRAYPLLKREYGDYWNGEHHATPIGLATNRDLGDPLLSPAYAAEAETGLDWTPIYGGDVRRCVPLITNCALVLYARVLAAMAQALGRDTEAERYRADGDERAELIRRFCWDDRRGVFVEFDYVADEQLPYVSDCMLWPLWARVATDQQADRVRGNLPLLEQAHGLATTDRAYDDPHDAPPGLEEGGFSDAVHGAGGQLQWMHPAGWPPMQLVAVEGLDAYGHAEDAERLARRFVTLVLRHHRETGKLWEKYNVVDGTLELPNSRYGNAAMPTSWTTSALVVLGRRVFGG